MIKNILIILIVLTSIGEKGYSQNSDTTKKGHYFKVVRNPQSKLTLPEFRGGEDGWKAYLDKNLKTDLVNKYIKFNGKRKKAQQRVAVQFVVAKTGRVTNVEVIDTTSVHPMLAAEAIRLIKEGPLWQPADVDGQKINSRAVQYITFKASRE